MGFAADPILLGEGLEKMLLELGAHERNPEDPNKIRREINVLFHLLKMARGKLLRVAGNHVLVPSWTDNDDYLYRTRAFIKTLDNVEKIEVLPFHKLGEYKWESLGIPYLLKAIEPPSAERVKNAEDILQGRKVRKD